MPNEHSLPTEIAALGILVQLVNVVSKRLELSVTCQPSAQTALVIDNAWRRKVTANSSVSCRYCLVKSDLLLTGDASLGHKYNLDHSL